ncbi:MAG: AMP-binding protein [Spongiibacteraceae bacterium]
MIPINPFTDSEKIAAELQMLKVPVVIADHQDWAMPAIRGAATAIGAVGIALNKASRAEPGSEKSPSLLIAPLVHIGGIYTGLTSIVSGRPLVILEKFNVADWHDVVKRHRPKVAALPPTAIRMVLDACVVGIPDERLGAVPVAAVQARDGMLHQVSEAALIAHVRKLMVAYMVPIAIRVLPELPRTPAMKISKYEVRKLFDV